MSILKFIILMKEPGIFRETAYKSNTTVAYTIVRASIYVVAEACTYLVAACMLTLRPLKRYIFGEYSISRAIGSFIERKLANPSGSSHFRFKSVVSGTPQLPV